MDITTPSLSNGQKLIQRLRNRNRNLHSTTVQPDEISSESIELIMDEQENIDPQQNSL